MKKHHYVTSSLWVVKRIAAGKLTFLLSKKYGETYLMHAYFLKFL